MQIGKRIIIDLDDDRIATLVGERMTVVGGEHAR